MDEFDYKYEPSSAIQINNFTLFAKNLFQVYEKKHKTLLLLQVTVYANAGYIEVYIMAI